ncbi:hypothetical protein [Haloferula sp.]|uniref:hypothetical protein n=1 Tax=Haloferula sp. TaxID=2497595 RepID=UPI003C74603E
MTTTTPHTFDIKIDRNEFIRVSAKEEVVTVRLISTLILFVGALLVAGVLSDETSKAWVPFANLLGAIATGVTLAWATGTVYASTIGYRRGSRRADQFRARVEGAFLRIIDLKSDRKIHFNQIVDYQIDESDSPNVATLSMNTSSGGRVIIPAVINALETRDLLAEVDSERE